MFNLYSHWGATQGLRLLAFLTSGQLRKEMQVTYLKEVLRNQNRPQDGFFLPWEVLLGEESQGKPQLRIKCAGRDSNGNSIKADCAMFHSSDI